MYSIMAVLASLKLQYVITSASSVTPAYLHAHTDTLSVALYATLTEECGNQ